MNAAQKRAQLNREAILSASPARLLTMLYDRLLLDLGRAEAAQHAADWAVASENLLHAQAIVTELSSSLRRDAWDGADGLLGLYAYVTTAMTGANIHRDPARTREAIDLLEPLRTAWHEAAAVGVPPTATGSAAGSAPVAAAAFGAARFGTAPVGAASFGNSAPPARPAGTSGGMLGFG
ncbi:flagellar export chaperone FliS [Arthrobacter halodurans]